MLVQLTSFLMSCCDVVLPQNTDGQKPPANCSAQHKQSATRRTSKQISEGPSWDRARLLDDVHGLRARTLLLLFLPFLWRDESYGGDLIAAVAWPCHKSPPLVLTPGPLGWSSWLCYSFISRYTMSVFTRERADEDVWGPAPISHTLFAAPGSKLQGVERQGRGGGGGGRTQAAGQAKTCFTSSSWCGDSL